VLQGYLIGNGVTDDVFDGDAYLPFAAAKSLISKAQLEAAYTTCNGSFWNAAEGSRWGC
jgi:serine carboxypeptidase-like clade 1